MPLYGRHKRAVLPALSSAFARACGAMPDALQSLNDQRKSGFAASQSSAAVSVVVAEADTLSPADAE